MKFTKKQGCGNDYVYVNCFEEDIADRAALALRISDRHFGVGADGLICIDPSEIADFKMDMYNADGSQSPMCGNGIRCVGKYVYDHGMTDKTDLTIETAPASRSSIWRCGTAVWQRHGLYGHPIFAPSRIPVDSREDDFIEKPVAAAGRTWFVTALSMGNPHAVMFVPDVDALDLRRSGRYSSSIPFPGTDQRGICTGPRPPHLKMRVWERGAGKHSPAGRARPPRWRPPPLPDGRKTRPGCFCRAGSCA
jgi:diaminopimelate epimerase